MRAFLLLLLVGCKPTTAAEQVNYAVDRNKAGSLDGSLTPIEKYGDTAYAGIDDVEVSLSVHGVSDGKLCVRNVDQFVLHMVSAEEIHAAVVRSAAETTLVVSAHDSLDAIKDWPNPSGGVTGRVLESEVKDHSYRDSSGDWRESYWLHYTIEWCPPLPAIAATTKVITVTRFHPKAKRPATFVWQIKGTAVPMAGTAPVDAPTTTTPTP